MATLIRMTRSTMLEAIRQDYVRTARAKGAAERSVVLNHALRNALLPIVTVIGVDFGYLLGGTVVIESVFSLPGLGTLLITAIPIICCVVIKDLWNSFMNGLACLRVTITTKSLPT